MSQWCVELQGDRSDLQELSSLLTDKQPTIIEDGETFLLKSRDFDLLNSADEVRNRAIELIPLIDSANFLHFRNTHPIRISHIVRINDDDSHSRFMYMSADTATYRLRGNAATLVVKSNGEERKGSPQVHPIVVTLDIAQHDTNVARALRFYRKGDWVSLYKVYEIIRDDTKNLSQQGWIAKSTLGRFKQTAQSSQALGDEARHASREFSPPAKPMTIHEARAIIGDLLQQWVDSKKHTGPDD